MPSIPQNDLTYPEVIGFQCIDSEMHWAGAHLRLCPCCCWGLVESRLTPFYGAGYPSWLSPAAACACTRLTATAKSTDHGCFSHLSLPMLAAPLRILGNLVEQHGSGYFSARCGNKHLLTRQKNLWQGPGTVWIQFLIKAVKQGSRQTL